MEALAELTMDIAQTMNVQADMPTVYDALIRRLTTDNSTPDNKPMPMILEPFPGGRWFRDLGDSQGHLWGFVQVIKPPTLIEIHGPMFMSYPVASHLQLRLSETDSGTEVAVRHRALGLIDDNHRQGVSHGWQFLLDAVKSLAEG